MLYIISFVLAVYVILRGVLPLALVRETKIFISLLIVASSQIYLGYQYFGGALFSPELPRKVIIVCAFLYAVLTFLFMMILAKDIVLAGLKLASVCRLSNQAIEIYTVKIGMAFLTAAMLLSLYSVWEAIKVPAVKTTEIVIDKLPVELDGLKLVVIADLHASALIKQPTVAAVVKEVNTLKPDLILLTGDMIDGSVAVRADDVAPLKHLQSTYGVFGCLGNHEYYSGLDDWLDKFSEMGIEILYNQNKQLEIKNNLVAVVGVTDYVAEPFQTEEPDIEKALSGVEPQSLRILMAHHPKGAWENSQNGIDLQISGHTHGGMIVGVRVLLEPFNNGFISGVYDIGTMKLYVSNGTGIWNGFPVRLGVPAEITQLILRAR